MSNAPREDGISRLIAHIEKQLELFENDPANTPWQRGYKKSLERTKEYALMISLGNR